jgi:RNA polymerase sigma-B factor
VSTSSPTSGRRDVSRARRMELTEALLARLDDPAEVRSDLEDEIIRLNLVVAAQEARRYDRRGIDPDDLRQVAYLALVKAVRRYDTALATDFLGYVVPCIRGELRRWFRDAGWMVRPPRSVQELQARITRVTGELAQELGRSPRPSDIAARLGVPASHVEEAISAHAGFSVDSLDAVADDSERPLADSLVHHEPGYDEAEARTTVAPAVRRLGAREQRIVALRYLHDATQGELGAAIGVTQTQVSRLLSGITRQLRDDVGGDGPGDFSRAV